MRREIRRPCDTEIEAAIQAVREHLVPTPVLSGGPRNLWLKLETLQPTGSFKVRGALAALSALPPGGEVITASAGNHGLGMAHAATLLGRSLTVVVPESASPAKVEKLKAYPITLLQRGASSDQAEAWAMAQAGAGGTYISPYNDPHVIAGQSTLGFELERQMEGGFDVVCPVGGGGLCAGLGLWAQRVGLGKVFGVEAAASQAVSRAIQAGRTIPVEVGETLADGLAGQIEDPSVTWEIIRDAGVGLSTVTEEALRQALQWLFAHHGLVVEGSGAAALAAVLSGHLPLQRPTVVVLTGRNISPIRYAEVLVP